MQIDPQAVINDLLEQNKQLTLQISMHRAAIADLQSQNIELQKNVVNLTAQLDATYGEG